MSQMCLSKEMRRVGCVCLCKHHMCVCSNSEDNRVLYHVFYFLLADFSLTFLSEFSFSTHLIMTQCKQILSARAYLT